MRRIFFIAALFISVVFSAMAISAEEGYSGSVSAKQATGRAFDITLSAWASDEIKEKVEPLSLMLLIDVSTDSTRLAQTPVVPLYKAGTIYPSIAENTVFYALHRGEYKEVGRFGNKWEIVRYKDGMKTGSGVVVGEHSSAGESFTYDMYGSSATKLDCIKDAMLKLIDEIYILSPDSQVGIIFFGDELHTIPPKTLRENNKTNLEKEIESCEKRLSGKASKNVAALEEAANYLEGANSCILNISTGICMDNEKITEGTKAMRVSQDIRMNETRIYGVGLYKDTEFEAKGETFLESICSAGSKQIIASDELSGISQELSADIFGGTRVTAAMILNPCFTIADSELEKLKQDGAIIEISNGAIRSIEWSVIMPRVKSMPWEYTVRAVAADNFLGGNDIPVFLEGSGIYHMGAQVCYFESPNVNVGLCLNLKDMQQSVFKGEKVPVFFENSREEQMKDIKFINGSLSYIWSEKNGGKIGQDTQLSEVMPGESKTYILTVTYEPESGGITSEGKAVEPTVFTSTYELKLVAGSVKVKLVLNQEEISPFVFKLTGEGITKYCVINMNNRSEDGEGLCLESVFTGLVYGKYTLWQISPFAKATGEETLILQGECMVGYKPGNEKVDVTANNVTVVCTNDNSTRIKGSAYVSAESTTYNIDFSKEGGGNNKNN